jgi:ATP-dependent DNA helicase RecG
LSRAVTYQRRTLDQIDTKVIEHVREYGFITNRTLQRTFDMHVYAARDLLTDLRRREILEEGKARGGPGVRSGPGPRFPRSGELR